MAFFAAGVILIFFLVFRLGSQASAGVTLSDPVVWVEDGARGRILLINGVTEEVTASVDVGEPGDQLQVLPRGRDAVFLNGSSSELGVIGASSLNIDSREELDATDSADEETFELLADFDASRSGFLVSDERILVVDPGAGVPVEIRTDDGLGDRVVDAQGELVAVTTDATRVGVTNGVGQFISLAGLPGPLDDSSEAPGLARTALGTFVVDASRRSVNEVLANGSLGPTTCVSGSLSGVRIGGNELTDVGGVRRVLVHDTAAGVLSVSLPDSSDCLQIPIENRSAPENWGDPVAVDNVAYLPNYEEGRIIVVDLDERSEVDDVRFGIAGRPFELEVFDGTVWANEPLGSLAAVLRGEEISVISKISTLTVSGTEQGEGEGIDAAAGESETDEIIFGQRGEFGFGSAGLSVGEGGDALAVPDGEGDELDADDLDLPFEGELSNAPLIVELEQQVLEETVVEEELQANFTFSSDTVNAGEVVELLDSSAGNPTSWNWDFGDGTGANGPQATKSWDTEGVFTVTLFVANEAGDESQQSFDFTVVAPDLLRVPTADFTFETSTVEVGEALQFFDQSTGDPDVLLWSFGEGSTATGTAPTHTFSAPGQFTVSLTASNDAGADTANAIITVVESVSPPEAVIGAFPGIVEVGQTVTLLSESTNSPTSITWDFDDGQGSLGTVVRHSWTEPGTYRIRLQVSNSAGTDTTFSDITVEPAVQPPIARFGESTLEVVVGEEIRFNDLSLNNPTLITWEFGDNTSDQGANVVKAWTEPGTFTVTQTVSNDAGSDSAAKTVTVLPLPPNPPIASFTVPTAVVPVNQPLRFTDTSTGDPTEWRWDFGDNGPRSTAQSPVRPFDMPGTYTVTLTASNAGGSDSTSLIVTVVDPPVASFSSVVDELLVSFTDTSSNGPTEWEWDFGDGTASTAQSPDKTYALPGTYTVTLIATNEGGSSTEFERTLTVNRAPTAAFSVTTGALSAQFTNTSTDLPIQGSTVLWDFGDGDTTAVRSPNHLYDEAGTYEVTLTVTNGAGSDTTTQMVTVVNAPPTAAFTCSQTAGSDIVSCNASRSTGAAKFAWSAPDAANPAPSGSFASFAFPSTGVFPIELTVTAADGQDDVFEREVPVTISPPAPQVSVVSRLVGTTVSATASADQAIMNWVWSIDGDGVVTDDTGPDASFTVPSPATTYTITVTGTNGNGSDTAFTMAVTPALPDPTVLVTNVVPVGSDMISASATSNQAGVTWVWSISGNGSVASGQGTASATFNAPSPGTTYTVEATATNATGGMGSDSGSATTPVAPPPPPPPQAPTVTIGAPAIGAPAADGSVVITISATADEPIASWSWSIVGGTGGGASATASFTVPGSGSYVVTASALDVNDGLPGSATVTVVVP